MFTRHVLCSGEHRINKVKQITLGLSFKAKERKGLCVACDQEFRKSWPIWTQKHMNKLCEQKRRQSKLILKHDNNNNKTTDHFYKRKPSLSTLLLKMAWLSEQGNPILLPILLKVREINFMNH